MHKYFPVIVIILKMQELYVKVRLYMSGNYGQGGRGAYYSFCFYVINSFSEIKIQQIAFFGMEPLKAQWHYITSDTKKLKKVVGVCHKDSLAI